jgi:hypothetical protein
MPLIDLVEGVFDLLDFLIHWRFYFPLVVAIGVAFYVDSHVVDVSHPAVRWVLTIPVVLAGGVFGWIWNRKS